MIIHNPTTKEFEEAISSGKTLVDFWANWCGPCRAQKPIAEQLANTTEVKLVEIDVDTQHELTARFGVSSIPTLVLFEDGAELARLVGLTSLEELKAQFGL